MMSEIAELKKQMAIMQARLEELEISEAPAPKPSTTYVGEDGIERKVTGEIVSHPVGNYEDRQHQQADRQQAYIDEHERKSTEGLPDGLFRDDFGIVRRKASGEQVNLERYLEDHPDAMNIAE